MLQKLLDFLALVGMCLFIMVLVFAIWDVLALVVLEVLWYVFTFVVFYMLVVGAINFAKMLDRFLSSIFRRRY
jgi:hypothetical protein